MQQEDSRGRFGNARFATEGEIARAGMFERACPSIGYIGRRPLYFPGDGHIATFAGSGAGKTRDFFGGVLCDSPGQRMLVCDPRGELAAISLLAHSIHGEHAYIWNPMGLCGLPNHGCNPLDIIDAKSPTFHADCQFVAEALVALTGSANGHYFEVRARGWICAFLKYLAEFKGMVTLADLHRLINVIEADMSAWAAHLEKMLNSTFDDVRRTGQEILNKQESAQREFSAIMGELYANMAWLDDPVLAKSLENPRFSLKDLCDPKRVCKIFLVFPADFMSIWAPLLRLFFAVTMLYKTRYPERARILLLADECGQMNRFDGIVRCKTFGRGSGIRLWSVWQDCGQVVKHYGAPVLQTLLGSSACRQFFGVRDLETARLVSDMAGTETLFFDDQLAQDQAKRQRWETMRRVLDGGDPVGAAYDNAHFWRASLHRTAQARRLMLPEEVLAMEDKQILFVSGKRVPPILAGRRPYYERPELAGMYLSNPYHSGGENRVQIATRWGMKWAEIVSEEAPKSLLALPQNDSGLWSYVRGYKPRV